MKLLSRQNSAVVHFFFHFHLNVCLSVLDAGVCATRGHKVIEDPRRQVSYAYVHGIPLWRKLCDGSLKEGWYRFIINGVSAEIPTECPPMFSCGTHEPVWVSLRRKLNVGEDIPVEACKALQYQGKQICCAWKLEIRVKNCGDFLAYRLTPTGFCPSAYCVKGEFICSWILHNEVF